MNIFLTNCASNNVNKINISDRYNKSVVFYKNTFSQRNLVFDPLTYSYNVRKLQLDIYFGLLLVITYYK